MLKKSLIGLVILLAVGAGGYGLYAKFHQKAVKLTRIVIVGNSFTSFNTMPKTLARELGTQKISSYKVTAITKDGESLYDHTQDSDSMARFDAGMNPGDISKNWNVIVLQEQSQIAGFGATDPDYKKSQSAIDYFANEAENIGAKLIIVNTWAYENGDSTNADIYPNYDAMQTRLAAGFTALTQATRAKHPKLQILTADVGAPWAKVPLAGTVLNRHELYYTDAIHPSVYGSMLESIVLARTIDPKLPESSFFGVSGLQVESVRAMLTLL